MMPRLPNYVFIDDTSLQRAQMPNVLRSEMETGPNKTRPIQSVPMFQIAMNIYICDDKLTDFRTWYRNELKDGASWFIMRDPFDGTERRFRFVNYEYAWVKGGDVLSTQITVEAYDEL